MAVKPTAKTNWTVGNPNFGTVTVEPSTQKKEDGWLVDEKPPREFMNFLFFITDQWVDYFEEVTDDLIAGAQFFDAVVGGGAGETHTDLAAAVADGALGTGVRVRIRANFSVVTTIQLSKSDWEIWFDPGVEYSDGGATQGLEIVGDRISIYNGRFLSFSADAIDVTASALETILINQRFNGNTNDVLDNGVDTKIV